MLVLSVLNKIMQIKDIAIDTHSQTIELENRREKF